MLSEKPYKTKHQKIVSPNGARNMTAIYSLELIITGKKIQKSGFRSAVEDIALDLSITGTAENIKKQDKTGMNVYEVKVIGEGTEVNLREFVRRVNKINTFHQINKLDENVLNSKKQIDRRFYPEFVIKRDEKNEIPERMDEAVHYVKHLYGEMHDLKEETNKNFNELSGETRTLKEETNENFKTMEKKYHTISENLTFFVDIVAEYAKMKEPGLGGKIDEIKKKYKR